MRQQTVTNVRPNRKRKTQQRRKQQRKKLVLRCFIIVLALLIAITSTEIYKFLAVLNAFDSTSLVTLSAPQNTFGILMLGLDKDGGKNIDAGHTDSITYIGANVTTKQVYVLPIYRDTNISLACGDANENINRIYAEKGIECLAESTSAFLNLPVNNYMLVTMDGFIDIIDALGTIAITPQETFCSRYGIDRKTTYCFAEDEQQTMSADETMAYVRYRGGGNGERRANRQVEIMKAVKDRCLENAFDCYNRVAPHLAKALKTNFAPNDILTMLSIFGEGFDLETLDVIQGQNVELAPGNWTEYPNEEDKIEKTQIIREQIFTER